MQGERSTKRSSPPGYDGSGERRLDVCSRRQSLRVSAIDTTQIVAATISDGIITPLRFFESRRIATIPATLADKLQRAAATAPEIAAIRPRRPTRQSLSAALIRSGDIADRCPKPMTSRVAVQMDFANGD